MFDKCNVILEKKSWDLYQPNDCLESLNHTLGEHVEC